MNILFIAPVSPPTTGQSLASDVLLESWKSQHNISLIKLNKSSFKSGANSISRIFEIGSILWKVLKNIKNADVIYFTISESVFGNLKDILIYIICFRKLNRMVVHLHGGAGMIKILDRQNPLLRLLNKFFLDRIGAIIVLGHKLRPMYDDIVIRTEKIFIVPNFARDNIFLNESKIDIKFSIRSPIKILFLSNLITGKGYLELARAYISLDNKLKSEIVIDFAGGFETESDKLVFLELIKEEEKLKYHGVVGGDDKTALLLNAHVFCLPTYYAYEGQPISILEAYASGCAVITTDHSGIGDIFKSEINGFQVAPRSVEAISAVFAKLPKAMKEHALLSIGKNNLSYARANFRESIYVEKVTKVIEYVSQ